MMRLVEIKAVDKVPSQRVKEARSYSLL